MNKKTFGIEINNILQQILIKRSDFQSLMNKINEMIKERDEELTSIITNIEYTDRNINHAIKKMEEILNDLSTRVNKYINNRILIDELAPQIKQKFIEIFEKFLNIYIRYENQIKDYLNKNLEELLYKTDNSYDFNIFNQSLINTDEDYNNELYRYAQPLGENNWYNFNLKASGSITPNSTDVVAVMHYENSYRKKTFDLIGNSGSNLYEHLFYQENMGMVYYKTPGQNQTNSNYKNPKIGMALESKYHLLLCDIISSSFYMKDCAPSPKIGNGNYNKDNRWFNGYNVRSSYGDSSRGTSTNNLYHPKSDKLYETPLFILYKWTTSGKGFIHKIKIIKGRERREPHLFIARCQFQGMNYSTNIVNSKSLIKPVYNDYFIKHSGMEIDVDKSESFIEMVIDNGNQIINKKYSNLYRYRNTPSGWNINILRYAYLMYNYYLNFQKSMFNRSIGSVNIYQNNYTNTNLFNASYFLIEDQCFISSVNFIKDKNNSNEAITLDNFISETGNNVVGTVKRHKTLSNKEKNSLFGAWFPKIDASAIPNVYDYIPCNITNSHYHNIKWPYRVSMRDHICLINIPIAKDLSLDTFYTYLMNYNTVTLGGDRPGDYILRHQINKQLNSLNFSNSNYLNTYQREIAFNPSIVKNIQFSENIFGYREDYLNLDPKFIYELDTMWVNTANADSKIYDQLSQNSNRTVSKFYFQSYQIINNSKGEKVSIFEGSTANYNNDSTVFKQDLINLYYEMIDYLASFNDEPIGTLKFIPHDNESAIDIFLVSGLYAKAGSILKKSDYPEAYEIFGDNYNSEATEAFDSNEYFALPNFGDQYLVGEKSSNEMSIIENSLPKLNFEIVFNDTTTSSKDEDKSFVGIITKNKIDSSNDGKFSLGTTGNGAAIVEELTVNNTSTSEITKGNDFRTDIYIKVKPINHDPYIEDHIHYDKLKTFISKSGTMRKDTNGWSQQQGGGGVR